MSKAVTPEELYENYRGKVERYVGSRVWNESDRADVVHQIFLNAIAALETFDPSRSRVGTWLYAITRNAVTDYYRRQAKDPIPTEWEELSLLTRTEEKALTRENLEALAAALEELPERERRIVVFRFYHGLSAQETARRVGVSYANARFLQHSALKKLRRALEKTGLFEEYQ